MAKTTYVTIPAGLDALYYKGLNSNDRFIGSRVVRKDTLLTKKRKAGITQRSILPQIATLWAGFASAGAPWGYGEAVYGEAIFGVSALGVQEDWNLAAAENNLTGWQLFVQDQAIRIKNDMAGSATPSLLHQSWVGKILVADPAEEIQIAQYHPHNYWISKKVKGKKGMYEPVLVEEDIGLPITISLNYKSALEATSETYFAKFYAKIHYSYQGVDRYHYLEISFDLTSDWKNAEMTLSELRGILISYNLYIHIYNLRGTLYFDNIEVYHSAQNWARDPYCKDIEQSFTRAFYQVPKHWVAVILPDGAEFDSVYEDF